MDPARFVLALPDEPELLARLEAELAAQGAPAISVDRSSTAVLTFEANTADLMCAAESSRRSKWPSAHAGSSSRAPSTDPRRARRPSRRRPGRTVNAGRRYKRTR